DNVDALAGRLRPEVVQLWYQMALAGRRDLSHAPGPRTGFEMSLLRMLAFRPSEAAASGTPAATSAAKSAPRSRGDAAAAARAALAEARPARAAPREAGPAPATAPAAPAPAPAPASRPGPASQPPSPPIAEPRAPSPAPAPPGTPPRRIVAGNEDWLALVAEGNFSGPVLQLASHAAYAADDGEVLRLALAPADELLQRPALVAQLAEALAPVLGGKPDLRFEVRAAGETLNGRNARERDARQLAAEESFTSDPQVQQLITRHGARLVPDSIRPLDDA